MTYSIIGILAAVILLINNRDVLWNQEGKALSQTQRNYRGFLMGVLCYYVTDALWGILEARGLTVLLYADTAIHFAAMAAAVMLWTKYVVSYLESEKYSSFDHVTACYIQTTLETETQNLQYKAFCEKILEKYL